MTIILDLPADLETKLVSSASQCGLSLPEYVLQVLDREAGGSSPAKTGAEVLAYWQKEGLVGTRSDVTDSAEHARALRQQAETRHRG
jgi:hypothetical protein